MDAILPSCAPQVAIEIGQKLACLTEVRSTPRWMLYALPVYFEQWLTSEQKLDLAVMDPPCTMDCRIDGLQDRAPIEHPCTAQTLAGYRQLHLLKYILV